MNARREERREEKRGRGSSDTQGWGDADLLPIFLTLRLMLLAARVFLESCNSFD